PSREIAVLLSIGAAQLLFLERVPDHAAMNETVGAARERLGPGRARYVNGVLRALLAARREGASGDPRRDLPRSRFPRAGPRFHDPGQHPLLWAEEALSLPVALGRRWIKRWGEERAFGLARDALEAPDLSLRVVRGERADLERELAELGVTTR